MGGTPPTCPSPLNLPLPVDLSRVTSILYPGQVRGDYKAHGGFRFDMSGQTTAVEVRAAMAGRVTRAARYLASGEIQYTVDIENDCGIMFRYGHLRDLPSKIQAIMDTLPPAVELALDAHHGSHGLCRRSGRHRRRAARRRQERVPRLWRLRPSAAQRDQRRCGVVGVAQQRHGALWNVLV